MKKIISLLLALALCLSLCACGNKLQKQAYEVAEKLEGTWGYTVTSYIAGKTTTIMTFEYSGQNAGKVTYSFLMGDKLLYCYTGTYDVSLENEGIINYQLGYEMDEKGNIQKKDTISEKTLEYTYIDGKLEFTDGVTTLVFIEQ